MKPFEFVAKNPTHNITSAYFCIHVLVLWPFSRHHVHTETQCTCTYVHHCSTINTGARPRSLDVCLYPSLRLNMLQHTYHHMDHIHMHPSPPLFPPLLPPEGALSKLTSALNVTQFDCATLWRKSIWHMISQLQSFRLVDVSSQWFRLEINMLCLAAEAQEVKLRAGFNLADTYMIFQKKVSRFQLRFLILFFHQLGSKLQIPINELYKQIIKMSLAEKGD